VPRKISPDQGTQVSLSQIAELAGVGPSAVSNWRRRFDDFPTPSGVTADAKDLFDLFAVRQWLESHDRPVAGRRYEHLFFEAADLLRSEGPSDRVSELLCTAAALTYVLRGADGLPPFPVEPRLRALDWIARAEEHDPQLSGLFEPLSGLPPDRAFRLLEAVATLDVDGLRELFEWALNRRGRFVETRTHESVAALLASLTESTALRAFDPAVGEAGFLLAASRRVGRASTFYGQDANRVAWRLGRQRLLLHDVNATVAFGDSLLADAFPDLRADVVYCDPPYGTTPRWPDFMWTDSRWAFGIPPTKTADYAWIQHVIHHVADTGRGYVLLPAGTLFRRGREAEIRRELVRRGAVEGIIALAPGTVQHTGIPLALWIVRRPTAGGELARVLFIDAAARGSSKGGGLDPQLSADITDVVREWRSSGRVMKEGELARAVPVVELLATDADLLPSKWVHSASSIDVDLRRHEFDDAVARLGLARDAIAHQPIPIESAVPAAGGSSSLTPVRHLVAAGIAEVLRGARVRPEECRDSGVRALRTQDIRSGIDSADDRCFVDPESMRPRPVLTQPGDIIVSPGGGKPRAVVDNDGGHVLVSPLQALRVKGDLMDRHVLAAFLESPRNRRFVSGTTYGYARLDLGELEVPMLPPEDAARLGEILQQLKDVADQASRIVESARTARDAMLELTGADASGAPDRNSIPSTSTADGTATTGARRRPAKPTTDNSARG
jgi:hypothetical protein